MLRIKMVIGFTVSLENTFIIQITTLFSRYLAHTRHGIQDINFKVRMY